MLRQFSRRRAALLLGAALLCDTAQAQVPTREEVNPPVPEQDRRTSVRVDSREAFARGPCPLDQSDVVTEIRDVEFTGLNGAPLAPELVTLLAGIEAPAGDQPIRIVCDLRDRANAALRRARYIATVQVPPQRIEGGVLRLEVITGRIVQVRVRGDAGPLEDLVESRIRALQALDPLNEADAERILLLADDVPGLSIGLSLMPAGGAPGDLIGELAVDFQRFQVLLNGQNYNSRQLGRETAYLRGEINGLTGLGDVTYLALSNTFQLEEQRVVQLGHSMQLGESGMGLNVAGVYAQSRPDLDTLELRTRSWIGTIGLDLPLVRTVRRNLAVSVGYEHVDQRTVVLGTGDPLPLNLDKIRAAYLRLAGSARQPQLQFGDLYAVGGFVEVRKGLDIFGATKTGVLDDNFAPSRFEGNAQATIVRGELNTMVGLGRVFDLAADYRAQWSDDPLLNYDEFSLGNLTVGRGYDPGANTGDRAWSGSFELRANLPPVDGFQPQVYGFFDAVELWNLDTNSTEDHRVLRSVGGGLRMTLPGAMHLDITYAHPLDPPLLTGAPGSKAPDRVLVSLTTRLVPFGLGRP